MDVRCFLIDGSKLSMRDTESGLKFECVSPASRARLSAAISQSHRLRENNHRLLIKAGDRVGECSGTQEWSMR